MTRTLHTMLDVRVADSPIHGSGLFSTRDRKRGEILAVLDGQVVPHEGKLAFLLEYEWNAISADEILLRPIWTHYGFINHQAPGELTFSLIDRTLSFTRDLPGGSEITLDYREHGIPQVYLDSEHGQYLR